MTCRQVASVFFLSGLSGNPQMLAHAILNEDPYPIKALIANRFEPIESIPDSSTTRRALDKLDLIVAIDIHFNEFAWYSDVILPESIYLERGVGFLLAGTAIYLAGIVPDTAGGTMGALWMLLAAALALWIYGRFGSPVAPARSRIIARVIAAVLLITAILLPSAFVSRQAHLNTSNFSFPALVENSRAGKLTFVYFTADWCPNCFAVEKLTLSSDRVAAALEKHQVAIMKADITEPGTEAQALLEKLGSRSIPFAAVFPAGAQFSAPVALRDIYTPDELISAIEQAAARSEQGSEPVTEGFIQFNEK